MLTRWCADTTKYQSAGPGRKHRAKGLALKSDLGIGKPLPTTLNNCVSFDCVSFDRVTFDRVSFDCVAFGRFMRDTERVSTIELNLEKLVLPAISASLLAVRQRRSIGIVECSQSEEIERFVQAREALPSRFIVCLTPLSVQAYLGTNTRLFLTEDSMGGFGLLGPEISSIFSYPGKKYGDLLLEEAKARGGSSLCCYDLNGALPRFYARHGFREVARHAWKEELAAPSWNYAVWGTPDFVEMSL